MAGFHKKLILIVCVLVFSVLACNYPGSPPPTPFVFPTPNETMTALFKPLEITTSPVIPTVTATLPEKEVTPQYDTPTVTASFTQEVSPSVPPLSSTPPPSPTSTQTKSYSGPGMRSGASLTAVYMQKPPTINGDLGDWGVNIYQIPYVVYGSENWDGKDDLSGSVVIGWDETYLYVGARVKDNKYAQNSRREDIYLGDSIEILIDTDVAGDYYLTSLDQDDYQLGVSPGNSSKGQNPEAYLWFPKVYAGEISQVEIGVLGTERGYHIEIAIPWIIFNISPYEMQHFGFAFSVSDNDIRNNAIQQSMISNVNTRRLTNPLTWGDLTLTR